MIRMFDRKYADAADNRYNVRVVRSLSGAYNIVVDGEFWATAENMNEAHEEIEDIVRVLGLKDAVNIA